jgi:hypothetical protein
MTPMTEYPFFCPNCATEMEHPLPVEPLYALPVAAYLIPVLSMSQLYAALHRHKHRIGPAIYRRDSTGRRHRLISANDIRELRRVLNVPYSNPGRVPNIR